MQIAHLAKTWRHCFKEGNAVFVLSGESTSVAIAFSCKHEAYYCTSCVSLKDGLLIFDVS